MTNLRTENNKMEENASNYKDLKDFLEKLTKPEFRQIKEQKLQEIHNQERLKYIRKIKDEGTTLTEAQLDTKFKSLVANHEIQEIENFEDNYELFFQEPAQLIEIFSTLEENNLFLVQMTQDYEQN